MDSFKANLDVLLSGFDPVIRRQHFVARDVDDCAVTLASPACEISFESDGRRGDYGYSFFFINPKEADPARRRYSPSLVFYLRCPDYLSQWHVYDTALSDRDNMKKDFTIASRLLLCYCDDILAGDFRPIIAEGYWELHSFAERHMLTILRMPASDPIKVKWRGGDRSWIDDLKKRGFT